MSGGWVVQNNLNDTLVSWSCAQIRLYFIHSRGPNGNTCNPALISKRLSRPVKKRWSYPPNWPSKFFLDFISWFINCDWKDQFSQQIKLVNSQISRKHQPSKVKYDQDHQLLIRFKIQITLQQSLTSALLALVDYNCKHNPRKVFIFSLKCVLVYN